MNAWERAVEYHKLAAEWYGFQPWEGVTLRDVDFFAMHGDVVAQCYLYALRKAVPIPENGPTALVSYTERLLLAHVRRLNEMMRELAAQGSVAACHELWDQALELTQSFADLARKNPSAFRPKARKSVYMPSVRTCNPRFTADAKLIAEAIELSKDTDVGNKLADNRVRLGALCAQLVADCVHEIKLVRGEWEQIAMPHALAGVWPTVEQITPLASRSLESLISDEKAGPDDPAPPRDVPGLLRFMCYLTDCGSDRLHYLLLPELTPASASVWWKRAIEQMVEARFPKLIEQPVWLELLTQASTGTKADMLKELKDYSREKVKQFA